MTISIKRLGRGEGLRYLLETVVRGDGAVDLSSPLTRYYAESGTPPGRFLGAGLAQVDGGKGLAVGSEVTEEHLYNMLSVVGDPVSGDLVGTRSRTGPARDGKAKVAGFDLTFSLPKSISAAWAVADAGTQAIIHQAHQDAIAATLAYAEDNIFFARSGTAGIVQERVAGVVAAAFDHWDSRAGDPQLHTHVVVQNLAKTLSDGRWRTLDSRAIFKHVVMLSEMHQGVVQDLLADRLGWGFDARQRRHSAVPKWEVAGVSDALQSDFSQRSTQLLAEKDRLVDAFVASHGRHPTDREVIQLRQRATLTTRPDKHHHSLAEQTAQWRDRARIHVGEDTVSWVNSLADQAPETPRLRADDITPAARTLLADRCLDVVATKKATFTRANLVAEVHRQMHGWRYAEPADRIAAAESIADAAQASAVLLTPTSPHHVPDRFRDRDGSSKFAPPASQLFTTQGLLDAETRLLAAARMTTGPVASVASVVAVTAAPLPGKDYGLSDDQAYAVEQIVTSARTLDVLVGPAGTGKTTSMMGMRMVWEADHGPGSVIGLAPSAAAADVLGVDLAIATENTAKWLTERARLADVDKTVAQLRRRAAAHPSAVTRERLHARAARMVADSDRWRLRPGQLLIVDEASLAGTFCIDQIVTDARDAGAKVLLVGDWAQLTSVDAGGAFSMLVADRELAPELADIRRFRAEWEKAASVELRTGQHTAIDTYLEHHRVHGGDRATMLDALYDAWSSDVAQDRTSLMIAGDRDTVTQLNHRARADRVSAGQVTAHGLQLRDGTTAGVGDQVLTRENNRLLLAGSSWVKNGDRWIVTGVDDDGSMTVQRSGGGSVVLPASYVATSVDLAYAVTAHRAQGSTVDTAHALVSPTTTREVLYVAATRGRDHNGIYVDTTYDPDPETSHGPATREDLHEVLASILDNVGAEIAATTTSRQLLADVGTLPALYREYATIAREADHDHWTRLLAEALGETALAATTATGPEGQLEELLASESWGALTHALRGASALGIDASTLITKALGDTTGHGDDVDQVDQVDPAAALAARVRVAAVAIDDGPRAPRDRSILGLLAYPNVSNPDLQRGLDDRVTAMRARAQQLVDHAVRNTETWLLELGGLPGDPAAQLEWFTHARTVAAFRELHDYGGSIDNAIAQATGRTELGDAKAAHAAAERARELASRASTPAPTLAAETRAPLSTPLSAPLPGAGQEIGR